MAISSGTVTKRSTSGRAGPASVAICTCTLVTSGKASTDSFARGVEAEGQQDHRHHDHHQTLLAARTRDSIIPALPLAFVVQMEGALTRMRLLV